MAVLRLDRISRGLLFRLNRFNEPLTTERIAVIFNLSKPASEALVAAMEKKNLVEIHRNQFDKHFYRIGITEEGIKVLQNSSDSIPSIPSLYEDSTFSYEEDETIDPVETTDPVENPLAFSILDLLPDRDRFDETMTEYSIYLKIGGQWLVFQKTLNQMLAAGQVRCRENSLGDTCYYQVKNGRTKSNVDD